MNREVLDRPFSQDLVKTRPGQGGRQLSYVEGHEFIRRLNEAFDGQWSLRIVSHEIVDQEIVVMVELSADGLVKMAFGGAPIQGELADCFKTAATDALKKASTLFGLGLHLYDDDPATGQRQRRAGAATERPRAGAATPTTKNGGGGQVTERQLNAIMAIGRTLGWSSEAIRQRAIELYGDPPNQLSKDDASLFIGDLQKIAVKEAS